MIIERSFSHKFKRSSTINRFASSIPLYLFLAILIFPSLTGAEEIIKKGETLNIKRCIDIALEHHPSLVYAKSAVNVSETKVGQAKASYYPQIYWSSTYGRRYPEIASGRFGIPIRTNDSYNEYSTGLTLSQNILDFEKTKTQVEIQNMNVEASQSDSEYVAGQIILAVKQSYYGLLQAGRSRTVANEAVDQFQRHLDQAKGFFEVGVKPKFDVTKASVDLSNAKLNLLKAENALKVARVNLNNSMGMPDAAEYSIEDNFTFVKYNIPFEEALKNAYDNRSDLQSILAKKRAALKAIDVARKGYYPVLSGNATYSYGGNDLPLDKGWSVGATLTFPLFSGFLTKYQVDEGRANLNLINANEASLRQSINLEVQQAYLALQEAEDRISNTDLTVKQATENYELANGRYTSGVGSPIEVTDALLILNNAKTSYITALYDYKKAQASIEKAMGVRE